MLSLALITLAVGAASGAVVVLRRRRSARALGFAPHATPSPGALHLVRTLSDLSDVGIHLRADRATASRPRLVSILGPR